MLRYTTIGAKIIAFLSVLLFAMSIYLPFLEAFAYTPAFAFIHRFSITLNIGSFTKTLQPILFVIPVLLIKALFEYHKRFNISSIFKTPIAKIILGFIFIDLISIITSQAKLMSFSVFIMHLANYAILITSSIWMKLVSDSLNKEKLQKVGIKLLTIFSVALIAFTTINALASVTQFLDCSLTTQGCRVWAKIDNTFPNKLLPVGHQVFSTSPKVIRAPGLFGDVNFNGMYGIFITISSGFIFIIWEFMKKDKGYIPAKEQKALIIPFVAGLVTFFLTLSRSALLGAFILAIVLYFTVIHKLIFNTTNSGFSKKRILTIIVSILGTGILLFAVGFAIPLKTNSVKTSVSREILDYSIGLFNPKQSSTNGHIILFKRAIEIGNSKPIFGVGAGTFSEIYSQKYLKKADSDISPHSTLALIYAEQGLVGLIGTLSIFAYIWILVIKSAVNYSSELKRTISENKRLTKEQILFAGSNGLFLISAFAIPFFTITTITYYGFFLPMVWWWGNKFLLTND